MKIARWKISLSIVFLVFAGLVFTSPMVNAVPPPPLVSPYVSFTGPVDALNTLFSYVQGTLAPTAFQKSTSQKTLLGMITATTKLAQKGSYYQASLKLLNIWDNIDTWIKNGDSDSILIGDIDAAFYALFDAEQTTVPTLFGLVSGADAGNDSWVWAGVPYAKPPVGTLRWKAPQDPKKWSGIRASTLNYNPAVQPKQTTQWLPDPLPNGSVIGSEDCLYLNVFRPQNGDTNLPVFFWIHGGVNYFGQSSVYNAALLASQENIVVVVIQYRLGPFGWLYLPALNPKGTAADRSGNYGTLDHIKALKWVKNNIRFFGGNPNNITVGGQSAGGFNTANLLTSPLVRNAGLFQKALIMSLGGGDIAASTDLAYTIAGNLGKVVPPPGPGRTTKTDAQVAAFLRKQPANAIEQALMVNGTIQLGAIAPFIDGTVIDNDIPTNISNGNYSQIPTILGSTEYEPKPFEPLVFFVPAWGLGVFFGFLPSPSQTTFEAIWAASPDTEQVYQYSGYYGALDWKAFMVDRLAISMTGDPNNQTNVWAYRFMWGGQDVPIPDTDLAADLAFLYGAGHATDIAFIFGWDYDVYNVGLFNSTNHDGRVALQQAMMSYLGNFVYTGDPNGTGLTEWDEWSLTADNDNGCIADGAGTNTYISFNADDTAAVIGMQDDFFTDVCVTNIVENDLGLDQDSKDRVETFFFFKPRP